MAKNFLVPISLNQQEIQNAVIQILGTDPGAPVNGQFWINSTSWTLKVRLNGITVQLGRLDQLSVPTADVSLNGHKITGLADGTADTDAATVGQVAASQNGMTWKDGVRVATTTDGLLGSAYQSGETIDGITLTGGDRILLKNQANGAENGIYVVNATGAPTRAIDADTSAEVPPAMVVPVEEGSANADSMWILTTNAPITLGSTALTFAEIPIGAGASYVAGDGLTESPAGTFNINPGSGLEIASDTVRLAAAAAGDGLTGGAGSALGVGAGTGITVAADAVSVDSTVVARHTAEVPIGDGAAVQFDIAHNFGTRAVQVEVYRNSTPWDTVECDVQRPDINTVRLLFSAPPTTGEYAAVVVG